MTAVSVPPFGVVPGGLVQRALQGRECEIAELIEQTYRAHGAGATVNPPSYFLRFPEQPANRIIALPATLNGTAPLAGLKWISSFPANVHSGVPRASAVLILNDAVTGYPFACLESSIISATRTASSAAVAADRLTRTRPRPRTVGYVGTGLIARYVHTHLRATGWDFDEVHLHDLDPASTAGFAHHLQRAAEPARISVREDPGELIRRCELIVFATVAGRPHVHEPDWFAHHPVVLHVSLRDLAPEVLLDAVNIVDDIEHCLKADTSPHLVEQRTGNRDFLAGTLPDVLEQRLDVPGDRTVIFSPFGLGVLDLALGRFVYDTVRASGELVVIDDFFHEQRRFG